MLRVSIRATCLFRGTISSRSSKQNKPSSTLSPTSGKRWTVIVARWHMWKRMINALSKCHSGLTPSSPACVCPSTSTTHTHTPTQTERIKERISSGGGCDWWYWSREWRISSHKLWKWIPAGLFSSLRRLCWDLSAWGPARNPSQRLQDNGFGMTSTRLFVLLSPLFYGEVYNYFFPCGCHLTLWPLPTAGTYLPSRSWNEFSGSGLIWVANLCLASEILTF